MAFLITWVPTVISGIVLIIVFAGRNWLKARIEGSVKHDFDQKLTTINADLRAREAEISTLRGAVLGGRANRQTLFDKRRFEAVEKVWTAVNDLAALKNLSSMMATLNFKAIAKEADNPRIQEFLSLIGVAAPDPKNLKNIARDEQPFLPELAWAYFEAYKAILYASYARYTVLKVGFKDGDKYLTSEPLKKIVKAALPHQSKFIDEYEPETYYYLLEELEANLLVELRKILEGKEADKADAEHAKEIMAALKDAEEERVQETIPAEIKRA